MQDTVHPDRRETRHWLYWCSKVYTDKRPMEYQPPGARLETQLNPHADASTHFHLSKEKDEVSGVPSYGPAVDKLHAKFELFATRKNIFPQVFVRMRITFCCL